MEPVVQIDQKILGGTPCFAGTRVPVKGLFDYIEGGQTINDFLAQFPNVRREQVRRLLDSARTTAEAGAMPGVRE